MIALFPAWRLLTTRHPCAHEYSVHLDHNQSSYMYMYKHWSVQFWAEFANPCLWRFCIPLLAVAEPAYKNVFKAENIYKVDFGLAGSRGMVRVSYSQVRCWNTHPCHFLYFKYVLPPGPISTSKYIFINRLFYPQLKEMATWGFQEGHFQAPATHMVDWRSSSMDNGGLCAMTHLVSLMQM